MKDPTVPLWIITEDDRSVLSAHCQVESCCNIVSVLFYIDTFNGVQGKLAFTDLKCAWNVSNCNKDVPFAEVQDINFRYATKLKERLDETMEILANNALCLVQKELKTTVKQRDSIRAPSQAKLNSDRKLDISKSKLVASSLIHPYCETFVTKSRTVETVPNLYHKKYLNIQHNELLEACAKVNKQYKILLFPKMHLTKII